MFISLISIVYFLVGDLWFVVEFMSKGEMNTASIIVAAISMMWFDFYVFFPYVIKKTKYRNGEAKS